MTQSTQILLIQTDYSVLYLISMFISSSGEKKNKIEILTKPLGILLPEDLYMQQ